MANYSLDQAGNLYTATLINGDGAVIVCRREVDTYQHAKRWAAKCVRDRAYRQQWIVEVRPVAKQPTHRDRQINRLNNTPMDQLRFADFLNLKVGGKDEYSDLRGAMLSGLVRDEDYKAICEDIKYSKGRESACRWVLRGLEASRAVRKVKTDDQVTANAVAFADDYEDDWEDD